MNKILRYTLCISYFYYYICLNLVPFSAYQQKEIVSQYQNSKELLRMIKHNKLSILEAIQQILRINKGDKLSILEASQQILKTNKGDNLSILETIQQILKINQDYKQDILKINKDYKKNYKNYNINNNRFSSSNTNLTYKDERNEGKKSYKHQQEVSNRDQQEVSNRDEYYYKVFESVYECFNTDQLFFKETSSTCITTLKKIVSSSGMTSDIKLFLFLKDQSFNKIPFIDDIRQDFNSNEFKEELRKIMLDCMLAFENLSIDIEQMIGWADDVQSVINLRDKCKHNVKHLINNMVTINFIIQLFNLVFDVVEKRLYVNCSKKLDKVQGLLFLKLFFDQNFRYNNKDIVNSMNEQTDINDDDLNNLMQKMTKILNNADSSLFLPCINKLYDNIIYIRLNNCVLENNQFKESSSESMNQFIHMVLLDNAFFLKSFWKCIFDMFIQECRYIVSIDDSISVICQYMIEEIISEKRKKAYEMQLEKNKFISSPSTRYQTNNSGQFPEKIYDAKKNILSDNDLMSRASYVMAKDVMAKAYPVCITIDGLCVCMLRNMRWSADKDSEFDKTMSNYMNTYAQQDENNRTQTFVSIVNTDCINSGGNIAIIHKFDRVEDIIIQAYKKIIENQNNEKSIHNVCRDIVEQNKAHNKENKI